MGINISTYSDELTTDTTSIFNIYSLIVKQNHFDEINEEYVKVAVHNLRIALEKENFRNFAFQNMEILVTRYQQENCASY